jgi:predicted ATP-grasp superfamily ATP-dependent carboligase
MSTGGRRAGTTRILITDADTRPALAVTRSLGRRGHEVHVCSPVSSPLAGASRHARATHLVCDPLVDPERYVRDIAAVVQKTGAQLIMPITDPTSGVLLSRRADLAPAVVLGPSAASFSLASDKASLLAMAPEFGLTVPLQTRLESKGEMPRLDLVFPLVVKPHRSTNGKQSLAVRHAADRLDLLRILESLPDDSFPVLLQERIVGPGLGIFVLRHRGMTVARFAHRRLLEQPASGGGSAYSESVALDEVLAEKVEALLTHLDWEGPAMVEFKRDRRSGKNYLMEINGRFWGSLQLAIDAGVDFPAIWLDHVLALPGQHTTPPAAYQTGVRLRSIASLVDHIADRMVHSHERLSLPPDIPSVTWAISGLLRWHPRNRFETLRIHDPGPFLREMRGWAQGRLMRRQADRSFAGRPADHAGDESEKSDDGGASLLLVHGDAPSRKAVSRTRRQFRRRA